MRCPAPADGARSGSRSCSAARSRPAAPIRRRGCPTGRRRAVILLPEPLGLLGMEEQLVHALADLWVRVRHELCGDVLVDRRPRLAAVVAAEPARGRDPDVDLVRLVRVELDRVGAHPARPGHPALAGRVPEDSAHRLPRAAVAGAEEDSRRAAEPDLAVAPRLDVPGLLEGEAAVLGQSELLGPLPRLPQVARAVHRRAVDEAVRAGVARPVAGVERRVEDLPAGKERLSELPGAAVFAPQQEQTLVRAGE